MPRHGGIRGLSHESPWPTPGSAGGLLGNGCPRTLLVVVSVSMTLSVWQSPFHAQGGGSRLRPELTADLRQVNADSRAAGGRRTRLGTPCQGWHESNGHHVRTPSLHNLDCLHPFIGCSESTPFVTDLTPAASTGTSGLPHIGYESESR
jgi:hypothetical protein